MAAGIEEAERVLDLPQRSGRAVLGLALTGLGAALWLARPWHRSEIRPRPMGTEDYRPAIPELEEA